MKWQVMLAKSQHSDSLHTPKRSHRPVPPLCDLGSNIPGLILSEISVWLVLPTGLATAGMKSRPIDLQEGRI
jgi:hypothetical protein